MIYRVLKRLENIISIGFVEPTMREQGWTFPQPDPLTGGASAVCTLRQRLAVLAALRQAGSAANNRAIVLHDLLSRNETTSVLGSYRLQGSGDTTLSGPFLISRVRAGRLAPVSSIP